MSNNHDNKLEKLEQLNAQIDVWIDDENYLEIDRTLIITTNKIDISDNGNNKEESLESLVKSLFEGVEDTHKLDKEWQVALGIKENILPVMQVNDNDELDQYWSHLFYAKLLRAKIKQKGSDCYTRRLDDIAAYLERHLPQQSGDDEWKTRLTLIYLMELSAVSLGWESLGYSERARRVIRDRKYFLTLKHKKYTEDKEKKKAPYELYELWARFNIGVAYFHRAYYRKAVQEFNRIIWQVDRWEENTPNWFFFEANHGRALLYIPAIFSRSEVQLKLQFAYHTISTLQMQNRESPSEQKKTRAQIIEAQAYLQLGRLGKSWGALEKAGNSLGCDQLGQRTGFIIPDSDKLSQRFPSLGERFIDILIADHLDWLKLEGQDERKNQKDDLELRYIVKNGRTENDEIATAKDYKKAVDDAASYLNKLSEAFTIYFTVVMACPHKGYHFLC